MLSGNILLENDEVKISDFLKKGRNEKLRDFCGTTGYMAPEVKLCDSRLISVSIVSATEFKLFFKQKFGIIFVLFRYQEA